MPSVPACTWVKVSRWLQNVRGTFDGLHGLPLMKKNWRSDVLLPQFRENLEMIPRTDTVVVDLNVLSAYIAAEMASKCIRTLRE